MEEVHSTSFKETRIKLKKILATNGTPGNCSDYNEMYTNLTPKLDTSTTSEDIPKQLGVPITDEDETAIATAKTTTEENETTTTNETRANRPIRTKTTQRHLQDYIL